MQEWGKTICNFEEKPLAKNSQDNVWRFLRSLGSSSARWVIRGEKAKLMSLAAEVEEP